MLEIKDADFDFFECENCFESTTKDNLVKMITVGTQRQRRTVKLCEKCLDELNQSLNKCDVTTYIGIIGNHAGSTIIYAGADFSEARRLVKKQITNRGWIETWRGNKRISMDIVI